MSVRFASHIINVCNKHRKKNPLYVCISIGFVGHETFGSEIKAKICQLSQFSKNFLWVFVMFLFSARVPGSLSDRWSSLATIYPLRFHEIFWRWLSYNIKRQLAEIKWQMTIVISRVFLFWSSLHTERVFQKKSSLPVY